MVFRPRVKAAQTAIAPFNLAKLDNGYLLNNDNPNTSTPSPAAAV